MPNPPYLCLEPAADAAAADAAAADVSATTMPFVSSKLILWAINVSFAPFV